MFQTSRKTCLKKSGCKGKGRFSSKLSKREGCSSEETDVADDIRADVFVELLCKTFVLHQEVLSKRGARDLDMQLAVAHKDLSGVATDDIAHHLGPSLRDTKLE